jgi:hypothetical protein
MQISVARARISGIPLCRPSPTITDIFFVAVFFDFRFAASVVVGRVRATTESRRVRRGSVLVRKDKGMKYFRKMWEEGMASAHYAIANS